MKAVWLLLSFIPRWALEIALWLSYVVWAAFDYATRLVAGPPSAVRGCLGCLVVIPLYLVYFLLTLVSAPLFAVYALIGWVDIASGCAGRPDITARLDIAQATFYWPHIILYWLMPKLYKVEILGPVEGMLGGTPTVTYLLRDTETDENAYVQPGAKAVVPAGYSE